MTTLTQAELDKRAGSSPEAVSVESIRREIEKIAKEQQRSTETREVILDGRTKEYTVRHNGAVVPGFDITFMNEERGTSELIRALKWAGVDKKPDGQHKIAVEVMRYQAVAANIKRALDEANRAIAAQHLAAARR